jgi:Tol biopolymer transport system component
MKMCMLGGKLWWFNIFLVQTWFGLTVTAGSSFQLVSATGPEFGPTAGGGGDSYLSVISRDGRYVLFGSTANNLVTLGTNRPLPAVIPAPINVFLRDRVKGSTVLVSINFDGIGGGDADSVPIGVSTNGRYALFESSASNLVAGDTNNAADVFVRDLVAGTTVLVSVSTNGGFGDDASYSSVMTPDGRYVAFASAADNLVPGDTNGIPDVFMRDLVSNTTRFVSVGAQNRAGYYYGAGSDSPVITPDGRYLAFYSTAAGLAPGVQTVGDIYLRDVVAGTTTWVSADSLSLLQSLGVASNAVSFSQVLSDDGRFVAFEASPYPQASPEPSLVVKYDVQSGNSELIETNASVTPASSFDSIQNVSMTPDGRFVAYVANALDNSGTTTSIRLWDAQMRTNLLASANQSDSVSSGSLSDSPVLDDAGRFVAFVSSAPDLVTNQIPGDFHLYLRDLQAATTTLIDADTNGVGSPIDPTSAAAMSADGRLVAFDAQDGNLVPADRNRAYDVFVRDFTNAATELISAHDPGLPSLNPDGPSATYAASLTADARLIAFWGEADDLVANDTNGSRDIFVRDAMAGTNALVSVSINGVSGDGFSTDPAISADGRFVVFTSAADDLVSGDTNLAQDVFVRDLQAGKTTLVSVNVAGTGPGNADSYSPVLSSNGQMVLFHSLASDLRPGFSARNDIDNLFWRDLRSNQTFALTTNQLVANKVTAASMTPDGSRVALVTGSSGIFGIFPAVSGQLYVWDSGSTSIVYSLTGSGNSFGPLAISPDGQKIAYVTNAANTAQLAVEDLALNTNWVIAAYQGQSSSPPRFSADSRFLAYVGSLGSSPYTNQIYLYDFQTGTNQLVSQSYDGVSPGNDQSDSPDISADGNLIAYRSAADNLVPGDTNGLPDVFLFDRSSGSTTLITASRFGNASADNRSLLPFFSADGRTLIFDSWASDLIPGDFNNNSDVFALSLSGTTSPPLVVSVIPVAPFAAGHWLSWPAVTGKSYRVQFKDHLSDPVWQELKSPISLMGNRAGLQDVGGTTTSRFYRVLAY